MSEPSVMTAMMTMMRVMMTMVTVAMMSMMTMMTMMEIGVHDDRRSNMLIDGNRHCNGYLLKNWLRLIIDGLRLLRWIVGGHSLRCLGIVLLGWHGHRGTRGLALRLHSTEVIRGLLLVWLHLFILDYYNY